MARGQASDKVVGEASRMRAEKNAAAEELGKRRMSMLSVEEKLALSRLGVLARAVKPAKSKSRKQK